MCCICISEQKPFFPYATLTYWFCITDVEFVYCAERTESLSKADTFVFDTLIKFRYT